MSEWRYRQRLRARNFPIRTRPGVSRGLSLAKMYNMEQSVLASGAVQRPLELRVRDRVGAVLIRRRRLVLLGVVAAMALVALLFALGAGRPGLGMAGNGQGELVVELPPIDPSIPRPAVEPVIFKAIEPLTAMQINAAVPFSTAPNPAARRFVLTGTPDSLARATDCLATAAYYEAGDDSEGQRAVVQVVLNRVRHPSFPKTICGVVFQGSERVTGCQFSFTCDGSIARRQPGEAAWARAQAVAKAALEGRVYKSVGYATHYHTDWVVPYWSASLDKIAAVKTHLFFRWSGTWGTPRAFYARAAASEPVIAQIASFAKSHLAPDTALAAAEGDPNASPVAPPNVIGGTPIAGAEPVPAFAPTANNPNVFLVTLPASIDRERYPAIAEQACGARPRCVFMGWKDASKTPASLPASTAQLQDIAFHFVRDPVFATARSRWNCATVRRADPQQCLSHQIEAAKPAPTLAAASTVAPR